MNCETINPRKRLLSNLPTAGMIFIILVVLCAVLGILKPAFVSQYNIMSLSRSISYKTMVAFGQTLVLLTGGIDLSVAGMAGMAGIFVTTLMVDVGLDPYLSIAIVIAGAFMGGLLNGFFITKMKMVPFVVTLATGSIFTGIIYVVTKGSPIMGMPESATKLGQGVISNIIPYPVVLMVLLAAVLVYMLRFTPFGRHIYAVGGNQYAAEIAGIKTAKVTSFVYGLSAVTAAIAGIMITLRLGTAQPTVGADWVMPSVTAACIGGTSLSGGRGGIIGSIVGGVFMGVISNAIVILNVSPYWENVVIGAVVLVAIAIDRVKAISR